MAAPWLPRADVPESSDKTDRCLGAPVSGNISTFVIISIGVNMMWKDQDNIILSQELHLRPPSQIGLLWCLRWGKGGMGGGGRYERGGGRTPACESHHYHVMSCSMAMRHFFDETR